MQDFRFSCRVALAAGLALAGVVIADAALANQTFTKTKSDLRSECNQKGGVYADESSGAFSCTDTRASKATNCNQFGKCTIVDLHRPPPASSASNAAKPATPPATPPKDARQAANPPIPSPAKGDTLDQLLEKGVLAHQRKYCVEEGGSYTGDADGGNSRCEYKGEGVVITCVNYKCERKKVAAAQIVKGDTMEQMLEKGNKTHSRKNCEQQGGSFTGDDDGGNSRCEYRKTGLVITCNNFQCRTNGKPAP